MIDFLSHYTVDEFLAFSVALILVVMGVVKTFDTINNRFHLLETKKTKTENRLDSIESKLDSILAATGTYEQQIQILLESDKTRIKGEIIKEHKEHMAAGSIDYKTLDYLQRQYHCYQREGGNSYIHNLMKDIESLPLSD